MFNTTAFDLKYRLSAEWRKEQLILTGLNYGPVQTVKFDLSQATPEQRAMVAEFVGVDVATDMSSLSHFDGEPTIEKFAEVCHLLAYQKQQAEEKRLREEVARSTRGIIDLIERRSLRLSEYCQISQSTRERALKMGVDLTAYDQALSAWESDLLEFQAKAKADAEAEAERAERAEREKTEREQAKVAWISAYGSAHLKRAFGGGYDCQRRYVTERAAVEAPGFLVDFDDKVNWKSRADPSDEALDIADKFTALGGCEVVWLTSKEPTEQEYYENLQCEGVVIRSYLGRYDLVRIV